MKTKKSINWVLVHKQQTEKIMIQMKNNNKNLILLSIIKRFQIKFYKLIYLMMMIRKNSSILIKKKIQDPIPKLPQIHNNAPSN